MRVLRGHAALTFGDDFLAPTGTPTLRLRAPHRGGAAERCGRVIGWGSPVRSDAVSDHPSTDASPSTNYPRAERCRRRTSTAADMSAVAPAAKTPTGASRYHSQDG